MKIYNVNVYVVDKESGKLDYLDRISVKRTFFKVKEIVTGQYINIVKKDNSIKNVDIKYYDKYDFILAVKKSSLKDKNKANYNILDIYFKCFSTSRFLNFIDSEYVLSKELIEKKKRKYLKKRKNRRCKFSM